MSPQNQGSYARIRNMRIRLKRLLCTVSKLTEDRRSFTLETPGVTEVLVATAPKQPTVIRLTFRSQAEGERLQSYADFPAGAYECCYYTLVTLGQDDARACEMSLGFRLTRAIMLTKQMLKPGIAIPTVHDVDRNRPVTPPVAAIPAHVQAVIDTAEDLNRETVFGAILVILRDDKPNKLGRIRAVTGIEET